jgi:hypothetical protein
MTKLARIWPGPHTALALPGRERIVLHSFISHIIR